MGTRREFLAGLVAAACDIPATVRFAPRLFELRSYLAQPGRRDELIGMFERIFLDAYQAGGARIVGTFRSLDEPDRWVWMRAFPDAASRGPALKSFYGGPVWKQNADACNATIADVAEAFLLREAGAGAFGSPCVPAIGSPIPESVFELSVYPASVESSADAGFASLQVAPAATFVSDHSENAFPHQPVRSDSVFVVLTRFGSVSAHDAYVTDVRPRLDERLGAPLERARLAACARSALR